MISISVPLLVIGLSTFSLTAAAQQTLEFKDSRGNAVSFPQGPISFADRVVEYELGDPRPIKAARDPDTALQTPDYPRGGPDGNDYVCLGHGGTLTLSFEDNVLVDVAGMDLYIFEIGPDVEATFVQISEDGTSWVDVGRVSGSLTGIDIAPYIEPGAAFRYVRLRDDPDQGDSQGRTPGADIDAVGAIGSGLRINLESSVLFDFDKFDLKDTAHAVLDRVLSQIQSQSVERVVLEGHTDARGTDTYNQTLSERRARSVADYLVSQGLLRETVITKGFGETRPVAPNVSDEDRARNRRVEIIVTPKP